MAKQEIQTVAVLYGHPQGDGFDPVAVADQARMLSRGLRLGSLAKGKPRIYAVTSSSVAWNSLLRRQQNWEHWLDWAPRVWPLLVVPGDGTGAPHAARGTANLVLEFLRRGRLVVATEDKPRTPETRGYRNGYEYVKVVGVDPVEHVDPWLPRRIHLAYPFMPF